jgi:hypothetical protein
MQRLATLLGIKDNSRMDAEPETVIELVIAQHFAAAPMDQEPFPIARH